MAKHFTLVPLQCPRSHVLLIVFYPRVFQVSFIESPARSTKASVGSGYRSVAEYLLQFKMIGEIPMNLDISMAVVLRLH